MWKFPRFKVQQLKNNHFAGNKNEMRNYRMTSHMMYDWRSTITGD
jgi:hypothetical protein